MDMQVTEWAYWSDTAMIIAGNTVVQLISKGFPVYWINFADSLDITRKDFAYIVICMYLGGLVYPFFSPFNIYVCKKTKYITIIYSFIGGICLILFLSASFISDVLLKWSLEMIIMFIFGFCSASVLSNANHIATYYTMEPEIKEKLIVALDLTWVFATYLFVALGYAFDYSNGFIIIMSLVGPLFCLIAFSEYMAWKNKFNVNEYELELEIGQNANNIGQNQLISSQKLIRTLNQVQFNINHFKWVILAQVCWFNACRLLLFAMPGLWFEDIYGLSASEVGLFCLIIASTEFVTTIGLSATMNRLGVWFYIPLNLTSSIGILLVLIILHSTTGIPLWFAKITVIILYIATCSQFQCDLNVIVKISNFENISPRIMISMYFFIVYGASVIALFIVSNIWEHGNGFGTVLYASFCLYALSLFVWAKVYKDDMFAAHKYEKIANGVQDDDIHHYNQDSSTNE